MSCYFLPGEDFPRSARSSLRVHPFLLESYVLKVSVLWPRTLELVLILLLKHCGSKDWQCGSLGMGYMVIASWWNLSSCVFTAKIIFVRLSLTHVVTRYLFWYWHPYFLEENQVLLFFQKRNVWNCMKTKYLYTSKELLQVTNFWLGRQWTGADKCISSSGFEVTTFGGKGGWSAKQKLHLWSNLEPC